MSNIDNFTKKKTEILLCQTEKKCFSFQNSEANVIEYMNLKNILFIYIVAGYPDIYLSSSMPKVSSKE